MEEKNLFATDFFATELKFYSFFGINHKLYHFNCGICLQIKSCIVLNIHSIFYPQRNDFDFSDWDSSVFDVISLLIRSKIAYRLWAICSMLVADVYFRAKIGCICPKQRTENISISIISQTFHTFKFDFEWVCIVCDFCRYLDGSRSFLNRYYFRVLPGLIIIHMPELWS